MQEKELIIIGGGPAGLKAGEEAKNNGIDYLILEKGEIAQAWSELRPDMQMLSPCHPQRDWTSLSEKFPIWKMKVTRPFCSMKEFINYLNHYCHHFHLKIKTNEHVLKVESRNNIFIISTNNNSYRAKFLIISTGILGNPCLPDIPGLKGNPVVIHSHFFKTYEDFRSKRVVIIGGGNSAAEIALSLASFSQVYLITKVQLKFFSQTKNLSHIRGISESLLKELIHMGIIHYIPNVKIKRIKGNRIFIKNRIIDTPHIICATGYSPVLDLVYPLKIKMNKNKYPKLKSHGESFDIKNLFFIGPLAYSKNRNFFIHGFVKTIPPTITEITNRLRQS
jgi:thioredoxin reductase (NADPH)